MEEPSLFPNILSSHKPIVVKLRHFNQEDQSFINKEIQKLLSEGIIEESISPWWAQLVRGKGPNQLQKKQKKRICVDYSQTINLYIELDAYPLPRINKMINNLTKYKVFSSFNLKCTYHQVPLKVSDKNTQLSRQMVICFSSIGFHSGS